MYRAICYGTGTNRMVRPSAIAFARGNHGGLALPQSMLQKSTPSGVLPWYIVRVTAAQGWPLAEMNRVMVSCRSCCGIRKSIFEVLLPSEHPGVIEQGVALLSVTNGRRENARQRDYYHGLGHCAQHVLTLIALNALVP